MNVLELQVLVGAEGLPSSAQFQSWLDAALAEYENDAEVVIRIVDQAESAALNAQFRNKQNPTNVLSFPFEVPAEIDLNLLGDLVICAPVVKFEALHQRKKPVNHWAHLVVHGILHLLGYDHINDQQAEQMEAKEIAILATLNIPNPYQEQENYHA